MRGPDREVVRCQCPLLPCGWSVTAPWDADYLPLDRSSVHSVQVYRAPVVASGQQWHTQHPGCTSAPYTPWTSTSRPALPLLQPSLHPLKVRTVGRDVSEIQRILVAIENRCHYFKHSRNIPVTCELVINQFIPVLSNTLPINT